MAMKTAKTDLKLGCSFTALGLASAAFLLMPDAYAIVPGTSIVGRAVCTLLAGPMIGTVATGIATVGVATIGILALVGRVTWTQALVVGVGCAVVFGAWTIAHAFDFTGAACVSF